MNFSTCFDNIRVTVTPRHQGFDNVKKIEIWTSAFAFRHHATTQLTKEISLKRCQNMTPSTWLGGLDDVVQRRQRFNVIIQRILCYQYDRFLACDAPGHIPHAYSKEMAMEFDITSLGVMKESLGSAVGCLKVLQYVLIKSRLI